MRAILLYVIILFATNAYAENGFGIVQVGGDFRSGDNITLDPMVSLGFTDQIPHGNLLVDVAIAYRPSSEVRLEANFGVKLKYDYSLFIGANATKPSNRSGVSAIGLGQIILRKEFNDDAYLFTEFSKVNHGHSGAQITSTSLTLGVGVTF